MCADDDLVAYEMSMDVEGSTAFRRKCNEIDLHQQTGFYKDTVFKWKCIGHDQKLCITQLWTHFKKTDLKTSLFVMQDIHIYIYNHNNNMLQKMRRLMKNCYITHGIGINSKDLCWMNKCNWYVLYSLYKAPLWLIGRCFYCMDCSCLFTFWRWSVLIYYIHISVKFLNGVFFQQQKKKIIPQCSCI